MFYQKLIFGKRFNVRNKILNFLSESSIPIYSASQVFVKVNCTSPRTSNKVSSVNKTSRARIGGYLYGYTYFQYFYTKIDRLNYLPSSPSLCDLDFSKDITIKFNRWLVSFNATLNVLQIYESILEEQ